MTTPRKILVCLQLIVLLLMVGGTAPASADSAMPENKVPGWVESTARRLAHDLEQQGYEVARGYFKLYTQDDCPYSYEVLHSCLGNNPAAPYVVPIVPAWPDEWVDPATAGMVGPTVEGYNASYRLDKREAIVILGLLPPPARYFGAADLSALEPGQVEEEQRSVPVREGPCPCPAQYVFHYAAQEPGAPGALRRPERSHQQCGDRERVGRRLGPGAHLRHHAGQDHGPRGPASPRPAWHPGQHCLHRADPYQDRRYESEDRARREVG